VLVHLLHVHPCTHIFVHVRIRALSCPNTVYCTHGLLCSTLARDRIYIHTDVARTFFGKGGGTGTVCEKNQGFHVSSLPFVQRNELVLNTNNNLYLNIKTCKPFCVFGKKKLALNAAANRHLEVAMSSCLVPSVCPHRVEYCMYLKETGLEEYSQVGRARVGFIFINDPCASLENYTNIEYFLSQSYTSILSWLLSICTRH